MKKFDSELESSIKTIVDDCISEDKEIYSNQQALLRRNELWYHGLQYIYWDFNSNSWNIPPSLNYPFSEDDKRGTKDYYDYVINIMKAHGESFISALSTDIPAVIFPPADSNEPDDISTARAYNKISELIDNHNPVVFLFIYLLFLKWNQGLVALYTYPDTNEKYGVSKVPKYELDESGNPNLISVEDHFRTRVLMEAYGPINFKIPCYVKNQSDVSYLILNNDVDYTLMQDLYDDDDIRPGDSEGKYYRQPTSYTVGLDYLSNRNTVLVKRVWIRPHKFRLIKKTSERLYKNLRDKYPNGAYFVYVGKKLEEIQGQNLDDYWTISRSGTSSHIISDPVCQPLIHIQDIKNTVTNLSVDIIEHSLPETFASPEVLNFDEYGKIELDPGFIFKAAIPAGMRNLEDGFFTLPKTQLNQSIEGFNNTLDLEAQFLIGNNPSVFGGSMGNRVPGEVYSQSKAQSLQRWGLTWHEVSDLWKRSKVKAVKLFVDKMADTESFTVKKGSQFLTTYIKRHELSGNVGEIEPQSIEQFPVTAQQKQGWLFELMKLNSPEINALLMHPENRETIADLLSFPGLHVPGTNQRLKQLIEFTKLSNEDPTDENTPSVLPDYDVDDHNLHQQILKTILASETGIELKIKYPPFYLNCILHLRLHVQAAQKQMEGPYGSLPAGYPSHSSTYSSQE